MADSAALTEDAALARAPGRSSPYPFTRALDAGGRVHLDRAVPYLVLNRYLPDSTSLATRLSAIAPSGVLWPAGADADREAAASIETILGRQRASFDRVLVVQLYDLELDRSLDKESPRLELFRFVVDASADAPAQDALACLEVALADICIDLREAQVVRGGEPARAVPGLRAESIEGVSWLRLGIPQIHRVPGEQRVYPGIFHDLEIAVFDALLRCFAAFIATIGLPPPSHHRALISARPDASPSRCFAIDR